ncbi:MAG: lysostaphin resistance A-like protein [Candidatus Odinarchaeota archaeon]
MKRDPVQDILKIILFMAFILIIVEISPIISRLFTGELFELMATAAFFGTFFLMYIITDIFARSEGSSIGKLGINFDNTTIPHVIIGTIGGTIAASIVILFAFFFGGQLRPVEQMTADLLVSEIIITVPTAILEELAHRGYILPHIEALAGKAPAIIISSIFFSFLHFSWWATPGFPLHLALIFSFNMFLGGVVLSISYYWSGRKLWVPIAFHFAWNMLAYIIFPVFPREPVLHPEIFQIEWGITTIIGFLIGLSIIWGILSIKKKE